MPPFRSYIQTYRNLISRITACRQNLIRPPDSKSTTIKDVLSPGLKESDQRMKNLTLCDKDKSQWKTLGSTNTSESPPSIEDFVKLKINNHKVVIFSKSYCPFCLKVKELFKSINVEPEVIELDLIAEGAEIQAALHEMSGQKTVPQTFINTKHMGGSDDIKKLHSEKKLVSLLEDKHNFDYDLLVIGGGSGGLSAAKEAASLGRRVAVCDFVKPSAAGSSWGIGGTCVNVGCIPKKLMHHAALLGSDIGDAKNFGWTVDRDVTKLDWQGLRQGVQDHIGSLNWGYRVQLRENSIKYLNAYATFTGPHTVKTVNKRGKEEVVTARRFIVATGLRPRLLDIPGIEYTISSDDIFSLPYSPGKTLCVGASYISLECGGFLSGIGLDVTIMVRSVLLRGFDQKCAELIGEYMEHEGVRFVKGYTPTKIEKLKDPTATQPGSYKVTGSGPDGALFEDTFNTVLIAVGREARTDDLGLSTVGVATNPKNKKLVHSHREQTTSDYIYGIGDVLDGRPELTPVAIKAGRLLVRRLYGGSALLMDYQNVATTVFTPLEYGSIGMSEEAAAEKYGEHNLEIYHSHFTPVEWTVPHRTENACYAKLICLKTEDERVVGLHILGPYAGEITQGYSVAMRKGATKADFDATVGIHPTVSEIFTSLDITKSSGKTPLKTGC